MISSSQKIIKKQYIQEISEKYPKRDYFSSKQLGKYNIKVFPKIPVAKKRIYRKTKNNVGILWEELEVFLQDDTDFAIKKIKDDEIIIRVLRKEAFHIVFIMAKIFGRILPFNAEVRLNLENYRGEDYKEDSFILDFVIKTIDNFYKGTICIIF